MNPNRLDHYFPQMVRNLVLSLLTLALMITSGTASAVTPLNGSVADIGATLLLVATIGIAVSGLVIVGLISWGRKQDTYLDPDQQGEQG